MHVAEHLVASVRGRGPVLLRADRAVWLWERLRGVIPTALACLVMPDHIHLVAPPGYHSALRRALTGFTRCFGVRFDLLEPQVANSPAIAARMIRYVFHNPLRSGDVGDPWCWTWSTLRDLAELTHPVWTPPRELSQHLQLAPEGLLRQLTHTADHHPAPPCPRRVDLASTPAILRAAAKVLRLDPASAANSMLARRLTIQTALEIGHITTRALAAELAIHPRTVLRNRTPPHPGLRAALTTLADPRLASMSDIRTIHPSVGATVGTFVR